MSLFTRFYSLCNEIETTDRAAKREYLIFNDNFGILFFAMIILSVKIQPVLVQTNAMHMPYILPKTERIRSFDYWTWSQVSIGKNERNLTKETRYASMRPIRFGSSTSGNFSGYSIESYGAFFKSCNHNSHLTFDFSIQLKFEILLIFLN